MIKQVIVIRRDLGMRRGKECAQSSHSSEGFIFKELRRLADDTTKLLWNEVNPDGKIVFALHLSPAEVEWIQNGRKKIVCQVKTEDELLDLNEAAKKAGIKSYLVKDHGLTEFGGKQTLTCLAIGPDEAEKIDLITGKLELY